jgi:hypothetical protein
MKIFYTLSAMAIFNLMTVAVLANAPIQKNMPEELQETEVLSDVVAPTPTPIIVKRQVVKKVTRFATGVPTTNNKVASTVTAQNPTQPNQPVTQPATPQQPAPAAPVPSGCIITLDGGSYNVTSLQKSHSGGDIFNCGSDMSATFWGKHGQGIFSKMQQYRI